jgi:hypothetical protein
MARRELHRVLEALRRLEVGGGGFVGADAGNKVGVNDPDHFSEIEAEDPPFHPDEVHRSYRDSDTQVHNIPPNNVVPNNGSHAEVHTVTPSDVTPANGSYKPGKAIYYEAPKPPETGEMLYLRDGSKVYIPPGVQRDADGCVEVANGDRYFVGFENVRSDRYTADYDPFEFERECEEKLMQVEAAWHALNTQSVADSMAVHLQNQVAVYTETHNVFEDLWTNCLANPKTWKRITNPMITELIIPNERWKYTFTDGNNSGQKIYAPVSYKGLKGPGDIWVLNNTDSLISWVTHITADYHDIEYTDVDSKPYIPHGLHVFKPLCKDLFAKACEDLHNLYLKEDVNPTQDISPDRMYDRSIPEKTMLFYSYKDNAHQHFQPIRYAKTVVQILRREGFLDLALYVMETLSTMAYATNTNLEFLKEFGSVMFLRYAPGEGFKRHGDGPKTLGPKRRGRDGEDKGSDPGPILNVTMGLEGYKVMDFTPSMCHDDERKRPIRVRCKPGEGILMWGESRVEWMHAIPAEDTWRFTMAIKLPGEPLPGLSVLEERRLFPVFKRPSEHRIVYTSYALKIGSYREMSLENGIHDIGPLPQFNYPERHLTTNGPTVNKQKKKGFRRPEKPRNERYNRDDDTFSVASTTSHTSSNASRNGFRVPRGQPGLRYTQDAPKGGYRGANRSGKGRGGWFSHGTRGRDNEFPLGPGRFELVPRESGRRGRW